MSDPQQIKDEAVEETFISHLVELRDRIIRAGASVIVVFIGLVLLGAQYLQVARPAADAELAEGRQDDRHGRHRLVLRCR